LEASKEKTFIHGFKEDIRTWLIDGYLRWGTLALNQSEVPPAMQQIGVQQVNCNLFMGPVPNQQQVLELKRWGITSFVDIQQTDNISAIVTANEIMKTLSNKKGIHYVYGFKSEDEIQDIKKVLTSRLYGVDRQGFPKELSGEKARIVNGRLIIGVIPSQNELKNLGLEGITTVLVIKGRDDLSQSQLEKLQELVLTEGLSFKIINYQDGYENLIIEQLKVDATNLYLITSAPAQYQIQHDLISSKLY